MVLMPTKPARACRNPTCPRLTIDPSGYCETHAAGFAVSRMKDNRSSAARRGYGAEWRRIREAVLGQAGIPRSEYSRYDVDHNPPYDPEREPDHRKYQLIPRLHADHSRKTVCEDGGWGKRRREGGAVESLAPSRIDRSGYPTFHTSKMPGGGI